MSTNPTCKQNTFSNLTWDTERWPSAELVSMMRSGAVVTYDLSRSGRNVTATVTPPFGVTATVSPPFGGPFKWDCNPPDSNSHSVDEKGK